MHTAQNSRMNMKRILTVLLAALLAASFTACKPGAPAAGSGMKGKAYAQQNFDGASVQNGLNPVVDAKGDLVTASQAPGQPVTLTTWDANGKQKSAVTTDVTDPASMLALDSKDDPYILATPQGGEPTVHVLDASGKTTRTIAITGLQSEGMIFKGGQGQQNDQPQSAQGSPTKDSANQLQTSTDGNNGAPQRNPGSMIFGMQSAPDGGVFISALGSGVVQFDKSGKQVRTIGAGGMADYITMNEKNQLIVYSMQNGASSMKTYDASNGKEVSEQDASAVSMVQSLFYDKIGKRLLYMTGSDIRQLSADGKTSTVLAAYTDFNLVDGQRQLMGFAVDGGGAIYLTAYKPSNGSGSEMGSAAAGSNAVMMAGGINEITRLALVDASTVTQKKTLTVAALDSSTMLDQVVTAFQKAFPDYRVSLKIYNTQATGMQTVIGPGTKMVTKDAGSEQQDVTSFIQALNTDLMSGNGADIIVLDGLPWQNYANKGVLADLGQMMTDKKFDTSPYYTNIFDGCKIGGKLYAVPASISYTMLTGKSAYMPDSANPTLSEFMVKAKALPQGVYPFGNEDATKTFLSYIQFCYPQLVDSVSRTAKFDSPEFIQAMNDFKSLIGANKNPNAKENDQAGQANGDVAYNATSMENPMAFSMARAILGDDMKMTSIPTLNGGSTNYFSPALMLGINASSKNQDAAWDFVQTMLGSGIQSSDQMDMQGYPVMKSAAKAMLDNTLTDSAQGKMRAIININGKEIEAKPLTDADNQSVLDTLSSLNLLQYSDPNVMSILGEELPTFFSGQKSAEDVASLIQNRVNTLLKE